MTFLPTDYKEPVQVGNYMKFEEGDNTFRVLSPAIVGYEWWVDADHNIRPKGTKPQKGDMPIRVKVGEDIPVEAADTLKHFWAFVVYNYKYKKIQILQINQVGIRQTIASYVKNAKWGDPKDYDIVVTKTKTGPNPTDVDYTVTVEPKEEIDPVVTKQYESMNIDLERLFEGEDPFTKQEDELNLDDIKL